MATGALGLHSLICRVLSSLASRHVLAILREELSRSPKHAMNNSALFAGLAVVLGFLCKIAGATCIDCASGEENVLLQRTVSSHNETALGPEPWNWFKPGYCHPKKSKCVEDVEAIQKEWKEAILDISASYRDDPQSSDYLQLAEDAIHELYGYDVDEVLFKPTLAVEEPFRPTRVQFRVQVCWKVENPGPQLLAACASTYYPCKWQLGAGSGRSGIRAQFEQHSDILKRP